LLAYDAELELISKTGERRVPYASFHRGYKQLDIRADELLRAIRLPRATAELTHYYRKVGTRKAQAISKICFAAAGKFKQDRVSHLRIALGSVAPIPLRCFETERALLHQPLDNDAKEAAAATFAKEISPIDDVRSTRDYRVQVSLNLLRDFLNSLSA
jgi:CO/xanthine dehydrogenase FAD-binding subunit